MMALMFISYFFSLVCYCLQQGYETTATAATNICALLAIYPDTQEKLFEEIHSILPDQKMDITQEDIKNMPYLDALIKEALRFFPVVPVLTRSLKEDMCLGEVTIPKGTEYIMDIWNMHRTRSNWKFDATKFNPENFFPQNALPRHAYSYIPFSAGPRNCIGICIFMRLNHQQIVIQSHCRYKIRKNCIKINHRVYNSAVSNKDNGSFGRS